MHQGAGLLPQNTEDGASARPSGHCSPNGCAADSVLAMGLFPSVGAADHSSAKSKSVFSASASLPLFP